MKTWLACLLCTVAIATQAQKRTVIILDVKGHPGDTITSGLVIEATRLTGKTGADGRFKYVTDLKKPTEALIWAEPNKTRQQLFIEPGDSVLISYDLYHPDSAIQFSGRGASNYRLVNEFYQSEIIAFKQLNFSIKTTTQDYINYLRYRHDLQEKVLKEKGSQMPPATRQHLTALSYVNYACGSFQAPTFMQGYLGKKILESIPDDYWSYGKLMTEDENMDTGTYDYQRLLVHGYPYFLFLQQQKEKNMLEEKVPSEEKYKQMYDLAKNAYKNPVIKSKALGGLLKTLIEMAPAASSYKAMLDDYLQKYCKDADSRQSLVDLYNKKSAISVGQVPPAFTLKDIDGHDVTLADFKGKVVYMDFWASWCGPCRYEMKNGSPGLHKQFEGNKDVVFLYISIDDSTDKWKQAIAEDKIEGIHLLSAGGTDSKVAQTFNIKGIPHYMLIDKEGRLFSNNTTRPSQPETAETIRKLLTQ